MSSRKNHRIVIDALNEIDDSSVYYAIVGKGDLKSVLLQEDRTGCLALLGFRTDIVDLLHAANIFIFPGIQEGLPVALMEAMAARKICVASRIRGNTDLINDYDSGFLFELNDNQGLVSTLIEVLSVIYQTTIMKDTSIEKYSIQTISTQIKNIYSETAE